MDYCEGGDLTARITDANHSDDQSWNGPIRSNSHQSELPWNRVAGQAPRPSEAENHCPRTRSCAGTLRIKKRVSSQSCFAFGNIDDIGSSTVARLAQAILALKYIHVWDSLPLWKPLSRWWFYGLSEICLFATITTRSRRSMFFTATWSLLIFSFPRAGLHWTGTRETERQSGRGNHEPWRSMEVTWWQVNVADSVGLVNLKPICEESQDGGLWNCEGRLAGHGAVPSKLHGFCPLVCFWVRCWPVQLQWQRRKLVRLDSPIFAFLGRIECIVMLVSF